MCLVCSAFDIIMQPLTADTRGGSYLKFIMSTLGTQATTFLRLRGSENEDTGDDVAHLLSRLPGLRCVGLGGRWADSRETWAAIMSSLSVCRDLRLLSGQEHRDQFHWVVGSCNQVKRCAWTVVFRAFA